VPGPFLWIKTGLLDDGRHRSGVGGTAVFPGLAGRRMPASFFPTVPFRLGRPLFPRVLPVIAVGRVFPGCPFPEPPGAAGQ